MPNPSDITSSTAPRSVEANLHHHTLLGPRVRGEKVALWHRPAGAATEEALSFGALRESANRVAGWLRARGVGPGDRVLVLVPMSAALYTVILGVGQVGATCVFIDPSAGLSHLDAACAHARPAAVFAVPAAGLARLGSRALRRIPYAFRVGRDFARRLAATPPDAEVAPVSPEDAAVIVYTTGSTGAPKPVRRSHGYIIAQLAALNAHAAKAPDGIDLPMWPMLLFDALCHGRTSVIPAYPPGRIAQADPAVLLEQMRRHGVTLLAGPPALYERLCDHAEKAREPLPVRHAFIGGAVVTPALLARVSGCLEAGRAYAVYGSTEVEPVAILSADELDGLPPSPGVCVGRPHPDLDVRLMVPPLGPVTWEQARWAEPGAVGEVVVSGPHVSVDYFEAPEAFAAHKLRDPDGRVWHRMGDLALQDAAGRLHVMGRAAHAVTTARGTLYPVPCERAALGVPGVSRAALVGRDGEAWLVAEPAPDTDLHALEAGVRRALEGLPVDRVVFHPRVPVDARHNSKVDLDALLAELPETPVTLPAAAVAPTGVRAGAAYMAERYPIAKNLVGTTLMVAADGFATLALIGEPLSWPLVGRMALMAALFWLVFFHLRVFDEHKDWAVDRVAYPERVLSRGWVTLGQLRVAAGVAIAAELALAVVAGPVVVAWTLVLLGYTWLMLKEFFVGEWLKRHMVLYGISHMAIISLMSLAAYAALLAVLPGAVGRLWHPSLLLFAAMNFCMVYSLEVARKIRVPSQERPHADTYSKRLGIPGALATVVGMQAAGLGLLALAARDLHVHPAAFAVGGGAWLLVVAAYVTFGRSPSAKAAKKLDAVAALTYLLLNVALIVSWGIAR
jgi:acyl-CoA synthetase (AMP-forming)/AMP-acid ligase II